MSTACSSNTSKNWCGACGSREGAVDLEGSHHAVGVKCGHRFALSECQLELGGCFFDVMTCRLQQGPHARCRPSRTHRSSGSMAYSSSTHCGHCDILLVRMAVQRKRLGECVVPVSRQRFSLHKDACLTSPRLFRLTPRASQMLSTRFLSWAWALDMAFANV